MRVNVYAEEMTDRIEIISKVIDGQEFTGLRIYLELPSTAVFTNEPPSKVGDVLAPQDEMWKTSDGGVTVQRRGPFMHRPGDDDSSAVTFWGKQDLRDVLHKALAQLDAHYERREAEKRAYGERRFIGFPGDE